MKEAEVILSDPMEPVGKDLIAGKQNYCGSAHLDNRRAMELEQKPERSS